MFKDAQKPFIKECYDLFLRQKAILLLKLESVWVIIPEYNNQQKVTRI